jgi:hypothetical protein
MREQLPEESTSTDYELIILRISLHIIFHGLMWSPIVVYSLIGFEPAVITGLVAILMFNYIVISDEL